MAHPKKKHMKEKKIHEEMKKASSMPQMPMHHKMKKPQGRGS